MRAIHTILLQLVRECGNTPRTIRRGEADTFMGLMDDAEIEMNCARAMHMETRRAADIIAHLVDLDTPELQQAYARLRAALVRPQDGQFVVAVIATHQRYKGPGEPWWTHRKWLHVEVSSNEAYAAVRACALQDEYSGMCDFDGVRHSAVTTFNTVVVDTLAGLPAEQLAAPGYS